MTADNPIVPALSFGLDDRKTLLDVYHDGRTKAETELLATDDFYLHYWGLIAVANHAAGEAVNYETDGDPARVRQALIHMVLDLDAVRMGETLDLGDLADALLAKFKVSVKS